MATGHRQGHFTPRHPEKYIGHNSQKIRYMSSWEYNFHQFLDNNPNILRWSSESIAIPYIKPTDHRIHKYYPDYWIEYRNKQGNIVTKIIEIKPLSQTKPPTRKGKRKKTQIIEQVTYAINIAKWSACQQFCNANNIIFELVTEQQLFT